eukprot:scaffold3862_cov269-Prasinococcus_capsulatus_cf.AAC.2
MSSVEASMWGLPCDDAGEEAAPEVARKRGHARSEAPAKPAAPDGQHEAAPGKAAPPPPAATASAAVVADAAAEGGDAPAAEAPAAEAKGAATNQAPDPDDSKPAEDPTAPYVSRRSPRMQHVATFGCGADMRRCSPRRGVVLCAGGPPGRRRRPCR